MIRRIIFLSLISVICSTKIFSQITSVPFEIPPKIRIVYPFIEDKAYRIDFTDETGGVGYFVMTLNKLRLNQYVTDEISTKINKELNEKGFLEKKRCWQSGWTCEDFKSVIDYSLEASKPSFTTTNNTYIDYIYKFDLNGKTKEVDRKQTAFGCKREGESEKWNLFLQTNLIVSQKFEYLEASSKLLIKNLVTGNIDIYFGECGWLLFRQYSGQNRYALNNLGNDLVIDFSTLNSWSLLFFKAITLNTKRINVTEDEKHYYIYFIKETN